jgi:hypothetical protein
MAAYCCHLLILLISIENGTTQQNSYSVASYLNCTEQTSFCTTRNIAVLCHTTSYTLLDRVDGGDGFLRNISTFLLHYMTSYPRRDVRRYRGDQGCTSLPKKI